MNDPDTDLKAWIDQQDYESLLRRWRHSPTGYPMFQGEIGDYYAVVMRRKKAETPHAERVAASKRIGWD